jgi:hypothetical protein
MEEDVGKHNQEVLEKGKELVFYQHEKRKHEISKEVEDLQQNCWNLAYEAQALVDETKTNKVRNKKNMIRTTIWTYGKIY